MNPVVLSGRTLAYLGDAVWSLAVRRHLIVSGAGSGQKLQNETIRYVSAKAQAGFYEALHEENWFTEEEEEVYRRGRNEHPSTVPHGTAMQVYRRATGFEAVLGMLDLQGKNERIAQILEQCEKILENRS